MNRKSVWAAGVALFASLAMVAPAQAATLSVDDDGEECPTAAYDSVQDAVDDANSGDTVSICPGTYTEGTGATSTNALTITKSLTIRGAGADLVRIQARRSTPTGGQIAANSPNIRDGVGNVVAITGGTAVPITVDISGVTVDGNGVYSEVGVLYLDAQGSIVRSRVTDVVTSEDNAAFNFAGGYRSNNIGYGIAQVTAATSPPVSPGRALLIDNTRVDKYNKLGVLIDGATNDDPPLTASGVVNAATIRGSSIIGRTQCINFSVNGNCATVGLLTTGPTFGQEGLRVTAGSTAAVTDSIMSQNLVNGTGAPTRNSVSQQREPAARLGRQVHRRRHVVDLEQQHRRQRLRRPEPGPRRVDAQRRAAQRREQLVGPAVHRRDQQRRPGDLADDEPPGSRKPREWHANRGRDVRLVERKRS